MAKRKVYKINGNTIIIKEVKWFDKPANKEKGSCVSAKAIEPIRPGKGMLERISNPAKVSFNKDKFTMDDLTKIFEYICSKQDNTDGLPFVIEFPEKW